MADNTITVVGSLGRDPELRYTSTGRGVASFGMAVNRRWQKDGEWEESTSWFNVVCWASLGENAAASLSKGDRVIVFGRLEQRDWEDKDGQKRSTVEIVAGSLGPDLRWAQATVEKISRDRPADDPGAYRGGGGGSGGAPPVEDPFNRPATERDL